MSFLKVLAGMLLAVTVGLGPTVVDAAPSGPRAVDEPFPPTYTNPRTADDMADPFIIQLNGVYYAFATFANLRNIPVRSSTDLVNWSTPTNALQTLPSWGQWGTTWAPSIIRRVDSSGNAYSVMYYTIRETSSQDGCISVAVSYDPPIGPGIAGPYTDSSTGPMICQHEWNGSIDPSPLVAPGSGTNPPVYLFWKTNEAPVDGHRSIWSQILDPSGLSLYQGSTPYRLMRSEPGWENMVIEGPSPFWDPASQQTHLLYAAHNWDKVNYATGWATCTGSLVYTSCTRGQTGSQSEPFIAYTANVKGPGGAETFTDETGNRWVVYHGHDPADCTANPPFCSGPRRMYIDKLCMLNGVPRTNAPTATSQSSARSSDCLQDVPSFGWGASASGAAAKGGWDIDSATAAKEVTFNGPWPNQSVLFRGNPNLGDQTAKAEVRWVATGPTAQYPKYGMQVAYKDGNNFAQVWLDKKSGVLTTYARVGGTAQPWQSTALPGFDFAVYHELKVVKTGTTFEFYLDGTLRQTRTFNLQTGQIGLITEDTKASYRSVSQT